MHLALSYIVTLNVTSLLFYRSSEVKVGALAMECFQTSEVPHLLLAKITIWFIFTASQRRISTQRHFERLYMYFADLSWYSCQFSGFDGRTKKSSRPCDCWEFYSRRFICWSKKSCVNSNQFFLWYHGKLLYVSLNFFSMIRIGSVLARSAARNVTHDMLMEAKEMCDILK